MATPDNEADLLDIARKVPAADIGKSLAAWSMQHEDHTIIHGRHVAARSFRSRTEPDRSMVTTIRQPAADGAALRSAVEAEAMRHPLARERDGELPSLAQQRCDAFARLIAGNSSGKYELLIHTDETGNHLPDGTPLTDVAVANLIGKASIRALVHDIDGNPVNATKARRRPTTRQNRVATANRPTCPNCGTTDLPNLHHTVEHSISGHTDTNELEMLCAPCHRIEHGG